MTFVPRDALSAALFQAPRAQARALPASFLGRVSQEAEGDVFVASGSQRTVQAVDLESGQPRWQAPVPTQDLTRPVASPDGTVWVCGEAVLSAFEIGTGEARGSWPTGARYGLQPVPRSEGGVVVGNWEGRTVAALDPSTGEPLWKAPVGYTSQPVATAPGRVYVNVSGERGGGAIQALDGFTGERLWRADVGGALSCPPSVGPEGTIYSATTRVGQRESTGALVALDPQTGGSRWLFETPAGLSAPAVPSEDGKTVFLASREGRVHALDAATGQPRWSVKTRGPVTVAPGVADGLLCIADEKNQVLLVRAEDGLVLAEGDIDSSPQAPPHPLGAGAFLVPTLFGKGLEIALPSRDPEIATGAPGAAASIEHGEGEVRIGGIRLPIRSTSPG